MPKQRKLKESQVAIVILHKKTYDQLIIANRQLAAHAKQAIVLAKEAINLLKQRELKHSQ